MTLSLTQIVTCMVDRARKEEVVAKFKVHSRYLCRGDENISVRSVGISA